MSIFKDIVSIWNSEDLLSQAWDESREMMSFSEDMFSSAIKYMRRGVKIKKLKKNDWVGLISYLRNSPIEEVISITDIKLLCIPDALSLIHI